MGGLTVSSRTFWCHEISARAASLTFLYATIWTITWREGSRVSVIALGKSMGRLERIQRARWPRTTTLHPLAKWVNRQIIRYVTKSLDEFSMDLNSQRSIDLAYNLLGVNKDWRIAMCCHDGVSNRVVIRTTTTELVGTFSDWQHL